MVTVTWKIDDGYLNNGTHETTIDESELEELSEEEIETLIEDAVQSDFVNIVSWHILNVDK
jgi:hypothetical protein